MSYLQIPLELNNIKEPCLLSAQSLIHPRKANQRLSALDFPFPLLIVSANLLLTDRIARTPSFAFRSTARPHTHHISPNRIVRTLKQSSISIAARASTQTSGSGRTCFRITFTHDFGRTAPTLYDSQDTIHICSATPLLMGQNIHSIVLFSFLHEIHVS